jgi:multiple sugar transport system permease protein
MFPRPIAQTSASTQLAYKVFLPIALIVWLLPLIGIAITSIRPAAAITF